MQGYSTVNHVQYNVVSGSYVVIPDNVPHKETINEDGVLVCLGFDTNLSGTLFWQCYYQDTDGSIERTVWEILKEVQEKNFWYSERIELLLSDLLLQTMRKSNISHGSPKEKLNMLINYLNANYTTDIDFRQLSKVMNYSYDYLRHFFKTRMKITMKQYVMEQRIFKAKEYLVSDMPISQIAAKCGFSSPSHFTAFFRQMTNLSPTEFRENSKNVITERNDPIFK